MLPATAAGSVVRNIFCRIVNEKICLFAKTLGW